MSTKTIYSTATTRFDLSAAALHILAMALMLMDHLWATLLPAQEWLTCAGRYGYCFRSIRNIRNQIGREFQPSVFL